MPKLKRALVVLMTFVMALASIPSQSDAAKKVQLNKTTLSLYTGKSYTLTLTNNTRKANWSSSKKSVATVSGNGRVSAKGKGNCLITARVDGHKYVCKVTVKQKAATSKKQVTYVYVTDTGSKYHRAGCRYLWNSKRKVSLSSAKSFGYTACSVCW